MLNSSHLTVDAASAQLATHRKNTRSNGTSLEEPRREVWSWLLSLKLTPCHCQLEWSVVRTVWFASEAVLKTFFEFKGNLVVDAWFVFIPQMHQTTWTKHSVVALLTWISPFFVHTGTLGVQGWPASGFPIYMNAASQSESTTPLVGVVLDCYLMVLVMISTKTFCSQDQGSIRPYEGTMLHKYSFCIKLLFLAQVVLKEVGHGGAELRPCRKTSNYWVHNGTELRNLSAKQVALKAYKMQNRLRLSPRKQPPRACLKAIGSQVFLWPWIIGVSFLGGPLHVIKAWHATWKLTAIPFNSVHPVLSTKAKWKPKRLYKTILLSVNPPGYKCTTGSRGLSPCKQNAKLFAIVTAKTTTTSLSDTDLIASVPLTMDYRGIVFWGAHYMS